MKKFTIAILLTFLSSLMFAQAPEWEWSNPTPTGVTLNGLYTPDSATVWAFGDVGALYTSKDGGLTAVVKIIDPAQRDLKRVLFADENVGYAVGEDGLLAKTVNGGLSWEVLTHSFGDMDFYDLGVVNADTAYACGQSGNILKTMDGGETWEGLNTEITKTVYSIFVVSADKIYAGASSGGGLLLSTDEGATWADVSPADLAKSIKTIQFISPEKGWFSEDTNDKIFFTVDSGTTWTPVVTTETSNFSRVLFINDTVGFAASSGGTVIKTVDGGQTWSEPVSLFMDALYDISYAAGSNVLYAVGKSGFMAKSYDLGETWERVNKSVYDEDFRVCNFFDEDLGFVAGGATSDSGHVLKTEDGGDTWTKIDYNMGTRVYGLAMPTKDTWYVARHKTNLIAKTTDGGQTFVEQTTPLLSDTKYFYDIEFINENFGYAVRSNGEIIKTTDGGENWVQLESPTTKAIYALSVVDEMNAYFCGTGAFRTTDGGETWEEMNAKIPGTYFQMEFYGDQLGFVSGYSGGFPQLAKTTDGGNTWNAIEFPSNFDKYGSVWAIEIVNPHAVWLGMINGDMIYTEDGGDSWIEYPKVHKNTIFAISAVGDKMYLAGNGGTIMKSSIPDNLIDIEPQITDIADIADDQGGKLRLEIKASSNDTPELNRITSYTVWREDEGGFWDAIGSFDALQSSYYYFVAPTLGDSTVDGITWSKFYVTAHTASPKLYYLSESAAGYSIDNLAPTVPTGMLANVLDAGVELKWASAVEEDFRYYKVYRSDSEITDPSTLVPIAEVSEAAYIDESVQPENTYFYAVVAVDYSGNSSEVSESIAAVITDVEGTFNQVPGDFMIAQNYPNPFNPTTTIKYGIPEESTVRISVYNSIGELMFVGVNGVQKAGYHHFNWNAVNATSGIYIYTIEASPLSGEKGFKSVMKMMLLK